MKPGEGKVEQTGPDEFVWTWIEGIEGHFRENEWKLSLEELSKLQSGETFFPTHRIITRSLDEQIAGAEASLEGARAGLEDLERRWPGIGEGEWSDGAE